MSLGTSAGVVLGSALVDKGVIRVDGRVIWAGKRVISTDQHF